MSQDEPQPLPLESGAQLPSALDHAWIVEGVDQQWGLALGGDALTTWIARVRCALCGLRTACRAADVPPCRPQGGGWVSDGQEALAG